MLKCVKTVSSSSAPLITKKSTKSGAVQRSTLSISSTEKSHILQNTVPSIIHTSNEENPICSAPISIFIIESATVSSTKVTDTASRFEREWKNLSHKWNKSPIAAPSVSESTTSSKGFTNTEITLIPSPEPIAFATPKETANKTSPTASSIATIGRRISVSGPFALYCFTTIRVAAGAVADAIAPSTIAAGTLITFVVTAITISTASTSKVATTA